jgi:hypothetical protein
MFFACKKHGMEAVPEPGMTGNKRKCYPRGAQKSVTQKTKCRPEIKKGQKKSRRKISLAGGKILFYAVKFADSLILQGIR